MQEKKLYNTGYLIYGNNKFYQLIFIKKIYIYLLFLCLNDLDLLGEFGFWSSGKKRLFIGGKKYSPCVKYNN